MPNSVTNDTMFRGPVAIPLLNSASLYKGGEAGSRITLVGQEFQVVKSDSGPTTIVAGDVAFWMNRASYIVTNKLADAPEGRNGVAGMFPATVTPGNYCQIQIGGRGYHTIKTSGAPNQGMIAVANSGSSSDVIGIPAGTAPTYTPLGTFTGEPSVGYTSIELTIGSMAMNP